MIFIHAFPLNQTMWDDQLAMLQNFCRTITLDEISRACARAQNPVDIILKVRVESVRIMEFPKAAS